LQTEETQGLRFENALWILMWVVRLLVDEMAANSRSTYTLANPPEFLNCRSALPSHLKLPNVTVNGAV